MRCIRTVLAWLPAALLLCTAAPVAAQTPAEEEAGPDARALARAAAVYVSGLPAFGFTWFVSHDDVIEGREKLTFLQSGQTVMQRGAGFVTFAEFEAERRDFYFDGNVFTVSAPDRDYYATTPFEDSFEALVDAARERTGTVLPMWTMMSADLPDRLASDEALSDVAYVGETMVAGQPAHHLSFAGPDEDWQLWISTDEDSPLPLVIVGTRIYEQGWPQYRVYFTSWDLAPEIAEGAFTFVPDDDDIPVAMPALVGDGAASEEPPVDAGADDAQDAAGDAGTEGQE
ncbi:MAG: DUF2092 domain-containing protein [Pseudomonadota bacterium]